MGISTQAAIRTRPSAKAFPAPAKISARTLAERADAPQAGPATPAGLMQEFAFSFGGIPLYAAAGDGAVQRQCAECEEEQQSQATGLLPGTLPGGAPAAPAVQRMAGTTPVSPDGEDVPELGTPSGQAAGTDNAEDPEGALASLEAGDLGGPAAPSPAPGPSPTAAPEEQQGAVQAQAEARAVPQPRVSPARVLARLGAGQALARPVRQHMERAFGHDFGNVRVHAGPRGAALSTAFAAHAFTVGEHVGFATGRYRPDTPEGQHLLAHELTHVVQQRRGLAGTILRDGIGRIGDSYEQEADAVAQRVVEGGAIDRGETFAASGAAPARALQLYSGSAAAAYAKKWATGTNSAYGKLGSDDCTNFASQVMEAGGWTYVWGSDVCDEYRHNDVWWFQRDKCSRWWPRDNIHASFTWGGAQNFFKFLGASGRGKLQKNVSDLEVGDVLQRDHADGTIHHTMIVTTKGAETVDGNSIIQIKLSYHTNDTLDRPFWGKGNILDTTPAGWNYYAWKIA